tara:strand:- start:245 stop:388 length:144 start_codon:yes stop_codon:yes gene_type:complete
VKYYRTSETKLDKFLKVVAKVMLDPVWIYTIFITNIMIKELTTWIQS